MEGTIGEIRLFAGTFAPRAWAFCSGQLLPIAQNTALFSILGTTYGGNGQTTFALPDLRSRFPVHPGQGAGLSLISLGEQAGVESVTLLVPNMPAHNHTIQATNQPGTSNQPKDRFIAKVVRAPDDDVKAYAGSPANTLNVGSVSTIGGSQPFSIRNPYLGVNYIICLEGIYPSRN